MDSIKSDFENDFSEVGLIYEVEQLVKSWWLNLGISKLICVCVLLPFCMVL